MVRLSLFILILLTLSSPCLAEDKTDAPISEAIQEVDFTTLKQTNAARIDKIIDGLTIVLKDGKIIRLSSLDIPGYVYPEPSEISLQAKQALEKLLPEDTEVVIYQTVKPKVGRENRMGQLLAHLETKDDKIWVQGYLLDQGLARVAPTPRNYELAVKMYEIESMARQDKKGLWTDKAYPLLTHDHAMQENGNFAVIEGTVLKAASMRNDLYLNFGSDWRKDFTVQVKPAVRKLMVREGIDPLSLNGKKVRVRGWVREYNGPLIELNHPASLQILENIAEDSVEELKEDDQNSTLFQNQ